MICFQTIPGQHDVKKRLIQSVRENRISHAQLFLGPEGSGTLPLAIAYSRFINCTKRTPDSPDACMTCHSCRKFDILAHPDLHFVYPVTTTKKVDKKPMSKDFIGSWRELVMDKSGFFNLNQWYDKIGVENKQGIINAEDCNEIIRTLSYMSYESEYKVMIIWMVEKLFHAAAPKLLKILEEPPDKTLFLLIAEETAQIISTILSRTQLVKIPKIATDDLQKHLMAQLALNPKQARELALQSRGNYIEALMLAEENNQDILFDEFRNWLLLCYDIDKKMSQLNDWISKINGIGRERIKQMLTLGMELIGDSFRYRYHPDMVIKSGKQAEFIAKFTRRVSQRNIAEYYSILNECIIHIERNANQSLVFMDASKRLSSLVRSENPL